MAQQYVQFQASKPDVDPLLQNLANNIAFRRQMELQKAQQAQALSNQMATGHAPKADFEVTDEGLNITAMNVDGTVKRGREASNAFYAAMGGNFGATNLSKEGSAETAVQVENPSEELFALAKQSAEEQNNRLAEANATASLLRGKQLSMADITPMAGGPGVEFTNKRLRTDDLSTKAFKDALEGAKDLRSGLFGGSQRFPLGDGSTSIPTPKATSTAQGQKSSGTESASASSTVQSGQRDGAAAKIDARTKVAGYNASAPVAIITNTRQTGTQLDEIRTSYNDLIGMAAFHQTFTGQADNLYSKLADQRAKDLERWEKAALNVATDVKVQDAKLQVEGAEVDTSVATNQYQATSIKLDNSSRASGGVTNTGDNRPLIERRNYDTASGSKATVTFSPRPDGKGFQLNEGVNNITLGGGSEDNAAAALQITSVQMLKKQFEDNMTDEMAKRVRFELPKNKKTNQLTVYVKDQYTGKEQRVDIVSTGTAQNGKMTSPWTLSASHGIDKADWEFFGLNAVGTSNR